MELKHWEDIRNEKEVEHVPDVTADIELSMNKLFLSELKDEDDSTKTQKIVVPPLNPLVLHAISLHKYANVISETIKLQETNRSTEKVEFSIPEYNQSNNFITNLNFTSKDFLNPSDDDLEICDLSKTVVKQILVKCIATLFAHLGYETCQQSALDVLTDVLQEFLKKICSHVKLAFDDEETQQLSGFPHIIERVLTEMGIGGIQALNDYYNCRIIKYRSILENRCKDLIDEYETLTIPKSPSPVDKFNKVVRVKVEEEDAVEVENPEVHFSTIDGDVNFSILETGYQLLNSLEAEANLHSMGDGVDDITVNESPGIVALPSDDASHLSPYNKKKKFK